MDGALGCVNNVDFERKLVNYINNYSCHDLIPNPCIYVKCIKYCHQMKTF